MRARFEAVVLSVLLLAGCSGPPTPPLPEVSQTMKLTSTSFAQNQPMPNKYSADGGNVSPNLSWSNEPKDTKSFALVLQDPDAPGNEPFVHWIVFNIPAKVHSIPEGTPPRGAELGRNSMGKIAYYGPRPPSGTHHYDFRLYALDEVLPLPQGATKTDVVKEMKGHELAMGELVGLYSKS